MALSLYKQVSVSAHFRGSILGWTLLLWSENRIYSKKHVKRFCSLPDTKNEGPSKTLSDLTNFQIRKIKSLILPRYTLPNLDLICAITEVIILDNDLHQHSNTISTNNKMNSKNNRLAEIIFHVALAVDRQYCSQNSTLRQTDRVP